MAEVGAGRQPFRFDCWQCGTPLAGWRTAVEQHVPCSKCGTRLRVLPRSPWPIYETLAPEPPVPPRRRPSLWLLVPFIFLALVWLIGPGRLWQRISETAPTPATPADWQKVEAALGQQNWNEAAARARQILEAVPGSGNHPSLELRRHAMAVLEELPALKELAPCSLRELLAEAQATPYAEWGKRWQERYHHRRLAWRLHSPSSSGVPTLAELGLNEVRHAVEWNLRPDELEQLRRQPDVAFALRLESCRLEAVAGVAPRWVVRFAPASFQRLTPARLPFFGEESLPTAVARGDEELRRALAQLLPSNATTARKQSQRVLLQFWLGGGEETWVLENTAERLVFFRIHGQPCHLRVDSSSKPSVP